VVPATRLERIFGSGEQTRDFVHVRDVAQAFLATVQQRRPGRYNIGSGTGVSVGEVLNLLKELMGSDIEPQRTQAIRQEVLHNRLSITKAGNELDWRPRIRLREGVREIVDGLQAVAAPAARSPSTTSRA